MRMAFFELSKVQNFGKVLYPTDVGQGEWRFHPDLPS